MYCHRRSNYRGVGHFGAKFANLVHHVAVAPMPNATKRAQEMHFEYKKHQIPAIGSRSALVLCSTTFFLKYALVYRVAPKKLAHSFIRRNFVKY